MICLLCGEQKARRFCPALNQQICPVCCGTKRLTQIACPSDCVYLAASREHPPAAAVRRQKHDVAALMRYMRDLSEDQSQLFFAIATFLLQYQPPEFNPLIDEDVAEGMDALAATFETAARGVIYEHQAASLPAERLADGLRQVFSEAGEKEGSAFQRNAAVVLRRVAVAARDRTPENAGNRRAFLDLIGRMVRTQDREAGDPAPDGSRADAGPRILIP